MAAEICPVGADVKHAVHNRFLFQTFDALASSLVLLRGVSYRPETLLQEHESIVEAISLRDPQAVSAAAEMPTAAVMATRKGRAEMIRNMRAGIGE